MCPLNIITLTTDFGTGDTYAGTMKGVILSINPQCRIVDLTHQISPQDIMGGCMSLSASYGFFPNGTIHLAVVDPGVGSNRRPILIETEKYFFVGPDNGIFSFILSASEVKNVFELTNNSFFLPQPCSTFHGRDIFAPVAAHLSKETLPACFGHSLTDPVIIKIPEPVLKNENMAEGAITHIDRFGNLITNFSRSFVRNTFSRESFHVEIRGVSFSKLLQNYACAEKDELFCLFGSSGFLEVSLKNGSAKKMLKAEKGDKIILFKK